MERWNSLSGVSPSSSSSSKSDVFLRAIVSVLAGTAVTVISAFVMKYIVVDSLADKMLGAPGIGDGSENPYALNQQGKTNTGGGGAISAHERLQTLRLSQHERSFVFRVTATLISLKPEAAITACLGVSLHQHL